MTGRRRWAAVFPAVFALCAGLLAGCGSGGGDGLTSISVGVSGNIFDTPLHVAEAKGYFRAQGLDVNFVTLTASLGAAALESDSVQFYNDSPTDFLTAVGRKIPEIAVSMDGAGSPLGLIVSTDFARAHHLTATSSPTTVARALRGSIGGASSNTTKGQAGIFLREYGVSPTSVRFASLPSPAADKAALNNHQIDWFVTSEPTPLAVQESGGGIVVAGPDTVGHWSVAHSGYGQIVVVRQSYAEQNADVIRRFVAAVQQGSAYTRAHEAEVVGIVKQTYAGMSDQLLVASLRQVDWPQQDAMSPAGWRTSAAFVAEQGSLPKGTTLGSGNWTNEYLPR